VRFRRLGLLRALASRLEVVGVDATRRRSELASATNFTKRRPRRRAIVGVARKASAIGITTCGSELALASTVRAAEMLGMPFYGDVATWIDARPRISCARPTARRRAHPRLCQRGQLRDVEAFASRAACRHPQALARLGQRGVSKVESASELEPSLPARAGRLDDRPRARGGVRRGNEFSVNAYTKDGETIVCSVTERVITHYPDPPGITLRMVSLGLDRQREEQPLPRRSPGSRPRNPPWSDVHAAQAAPRAPSW